MEIKDIIRSRAFLKVFIKDDIVFNSLKEKFPEIIADLTTLKNNANCSCRGRIANYLISKIENEKDFFSYMFSEENIKNIVKREEEEKESIKRSRGRNNVL
jgi:hypothetical protein